MKRYFASNNQTASASFAEASSACAEMNSVFADTVMVSVFVILRDLIRILGVITLPEPPQAAYA